MGKIMNNLINKLSNIKDDGKIPVDKQRRVSDDGKVVTIKKYKKIKTKKYQRNATDASIGRKNSIGKKYIGTFIKKDFDDNINNIVEHVFEKTGDKITRESVINMIFKSYFDKLGDIENFPILKVIEESKKDRLAMEEQVLKNRELKNSMEKEDGRE